MTLGLFSTYCFPTFYLQHILLLTFYDRTKFELIKPNTDLNTYFKGDMLRKCKVDVDFFFYAFIDAKLQHKQRVTVNLVIVPRHVL